MDRSAAVHLSAGGALRDDVDDVEQQPPKRLKRSPADEARLRAAMRELEPTEFVERARARRR